MVSCRRVLAAGDDPGSEGDGDVSTPAGDPISELTRGVADAPGRLGTVDEALAGSVREGVLRVEEMLHESARSDLEFATRTSMHLVEAGGKRFRPLFTLLAGHFGDPRAEGVVKSAAVLRMGDRKRGG